MSLGEKTVNFFDVIEDHEEIEQSLSNTSVVFFFPSPIYLNSVLNFCIFLWRRFVWVVKR